jgi:hypothetical protein
MMPTRHRMKPPTRPVTVPPYTRADAIADGLLVEVPPRLTELFRFTCPVAVTQSAWHDAVAWDRWVEAGKPRRTWQTEAGRLTEILWAARRALAAGRDGSRDLEFVIHRVPVRGPETRALRRALVLHLHQGDHGETVATIGPANVDPAAGRFQLAGDAGTV